MTKDGDYKRIVRRRARQSGRAYSAVRAECWRRSDAQLDQRWLVVLKSLAERGAGAAATTKALRDGVGREAKKAGDAAHPTVGYST